MYTVWIGDWLHTQRLGVEGGGSVEGVEGVGGVEPSLSLLPLRVFE